MIRRAAALALLALAVFVPSAHGVTIEAESASLPYQDWADASYVPTPTGTITVVGHTDQPGDCSAPALGCTDGSTIHIATWPSTARRTFLHELGHVFAYQHPELAAFDDEHFANSYSACARISPRKLRRRRQFPVSIGDAVIHSHRLSYTCQAIRAAATRPAATHPTTGTLGSTPTASAPSPSRSR
jgi:hypothetical protein